MQRFLLPGGGVISEIKDAGSEEFHLQNVALCGMVSRSAEEVMFHHPYDDISIRTALTIDEVSSVSYIDGGYLHIRICGSFAVSGYMFVIKLDGFGIQRILFVAVILPLKIISRTQQASTNSAGKQRYNDCVNLAG